MNFDQTVVRRGKVDQILVTVTNFQGHAGILKCPKWGLSGFPQALEIMENLEKSLKKFHAWKNHGI